MSLIICPECSHEVSSEAVACPNCGRPFAVPTPVVPRRVVVTEPASDDFPKWIFIPIVLIGALLVFAVFAMTRNSEEEALKTTNVNVAIPQRQTETRETTTRTVPQTQVEIPSSSTTVTTPPSTVSQTVPPTTKTEVVNVPSDRGVVEINAKVSTKNGSIQTVKNEKFYLLDEALESILSDADLEPIEGQTLTNSLGLAILYPERYGDFRRDALNAINKHVKYNATTDGSGKAAMKDIKPDSYYLFGITKSGSGFAVWSSPITIVEGENKLNLSPASLNEIS
ncbi:MAG: zinc ribbon domain-containing protein [Pyrinomonadaceae bacterium]|nr:zinc ribbon domain-containing protein [Pyrinomonadaceae bacterium]